MVLWPVAGFTTNHELDIAASVPACHGSEIAAIGVTYCRNLTVTQGELQNVTITNFGHKSTIWSLATSDVFINSFISSKFA
jgi:hypothetical protein